jgi:hypothetical protein
LRKRETTNEEIVCSFLIAAALNSTFFEIYINVRNLRLSILICVYAFIIIRYFPKLLINFRKIPKNYIFIFLLFSYQFFYTYFILGFYSPETKSVLIQFIINAGMCIIISYLKLRPKYIFLFSSLFLTLMIPAVYNYTITGRLNLIYYNDMAEGYSLIFGCLSLCLLAFYKEMKIKRIYRIIFLLSVLFYIYKIITLGNRGVYLNFITFILLMAINPYNKRKMPLRILSIFSIVFFSILSSLFISFLDILYFFQRLFVSFNIDAGSINKSILYLTKNTFDNGRVVIWQTAINDITKRIFIGNGVGNFTYKYPHFSYPHNIVLQFLHEGGVLYFLLLIIIFAKCFMWLIRVHSSCRQMQFFIIILISTYLLRLMVSSTYWTTFGFFLLTSLLFTRSRYRCFSKYNIRSDLSL